MYEIAIFLVICSGIVHSIWNLFAKQSGNKVVFLWLCQWAAILLFLPFALTEKIEGQIPLSGWLLLLASMALHGTYVLLLAKAYTIGDLSHVYPIMRGTAPLLVPLIGVLLLKETLSFWGWLGVMVIVIGIGVLHSKSSAGNKLLDKPTLLALSVGVSITCYTLVDKLTLQFFSPLWVNEWSNAGNLLALTWLAVKSCSIKQEWKAHWKTILLGGILAPGGYILFLYAMTMLSASQLAPMREIGTVFATILGIFVLKEQQGVRRLIAAAFITGGVLMLGIWGSP